jgi:hypothetical protein
MTKHIPLRPAILYSKPGLVGSVICTVALGQVFSEYFGFHFQFSVHQPLHIH